MFRKEFLGLDFDLWKEPVHLRSILPCELQFKWVKVH